jgi:glycosyltransferase involved in cell wall biosynthesis
MRRRGCRSHPASWHSAPKSELHWVEYAAAGAVTIASRCRPEGPYDVMADGVDGFLVDTPAQWSERLTELIGSRDLREQVAGRARERVAVEYAAESRAAEWAAVYRWTTRHAGIALRALEL